MCAISCASTPATCDSLPAARSTPRLIQTGPPGSEKALISGLSATWNEYGYFAPGAAFASFRPRRVTYAVTCGSRTCFICLRTCAFSSRPISISCGTETRVNPASAATAQVVLNPGRGGRRHFIRPMTSQTSVGSREFNAVHQNNGRHINPQQKDDDGGDRSLDEGETGVARDVPGEALEGDAPEHAGQRGADPDVAEPGLRIRDEVEHEADAEDQDDGRGVAEGPRLNRLQPVKPQEHHAEPRCLRHLNGRHQDQPDDHHEARGDH